MKHEELVKLAEKALGGVKAQSRNAKPPNRQTQNPPNSPAALKPSTVRLDGSAVSARLPLPGCTPPSLTSVVHRTELL